MDTEKNVTTELIHRAEFARDEHDALSPFNCVQAATPVNETILSVNLYNTAILINLMISVLCDYLDLKEKIFEALIENI